MNEHASPELTHYTVTWRLPRYNFERSFTLRVEATTPEDAAERMFVIANGMDPQSEDGQRWAELHHRSLSVGDNVSVNHEPYFCDSVGWRPSTETDPRCMEERFGGVLEVDPQYGDRANQRGGLEL